MLFVHSCLIGENQGYLLITRVRPIETKHETEKFNNRDWKFNRVKYVFLTKNMTMTEMFCWFFFKKMLLLRPKKSKSAVIYNVYVAGRAVKLIWLYLPSLF